jgi:hypothetical protein
MLLGHADTQGRQRWGDLRSSWSRALGGAITLLRHQPAVPAQEGIGLDDGGNVLQRLLAQRLANVGQRLTFTLRQPHTTYELVAQEAIFGHQGLVAEQ